MPTAEWSQIALFILLLGCTTFFLGKYIADVFRNKPTKLRPFLSWLERLTYKVCGINPLDEMSWVRYAKTLVLFNTCGIFFLFLLQMAQAYLPLNPQKFLAPHWSLALNTAVSFVTNTNWQAYSGESTMSYTTQMVGLAVQNFLSAATGMSVLFVLIRGLTRKSFETIGNFWADFVRSITYILLPLSLLFAVILVSMGVIQNLSPYIEVTGLEGFKQTLPMGPVASQVAIKQLGTNGGGFFNANSAHPFENPTALSNFLESLAILLIPAALVSTFGILIGSRKRGVVLLGVMFVLWIAGFSLTYYSETRYNPIMKVYPNLEGKEMRWGVTPSLVWAVSTTAAANGSVNSSNASLTPLTGGVLLLNMMLEELVFGGVGVGLCSMIMFVLLTVFLAGLMVGKTPEYRGKTLGKKEMQWVCLAILTPSAVTLVGTGLALISPEGISSISDHGPHGFSEVLYAFTSCAANNGSSFASLKSNTVFYNLSLSIAMILGRLSILIPSVALGGLLASKKTRVASVGTFSTDTVLFASLLMAVIIIVGVLTYFPALCLGPIVEHLLMLEGRAF